jgi:electron transport complex protein RnfB
MVEDVYERLAKFLDDLPAGYPRTKSGVEMRILRRLFTPEEAELAQHLTLLAEEARVIARRARIPVGEATQRLQEMGKKGLVYVLYERGKPPQYMAAQMAVGFYEWQVNKLYPELVHDFEEYLPLWFDADLWQKAPQLRTIPVGESIDPHLETMLYEQAEALVRAQDRFCVAPCICRQEQAVAGTPCAKPLETCLSFGLAADFYIKNGWGRSISQDEALGLLKQAEDVGLVLQPGNARDAAFICMCCGCCCGILRAAKLQPKPAEVISSPYYAAHNPETCSGCGTCETRCQMEAIYLDNGHATLDLDRCIGCGLCVTTCPTGSLSLARKPAEQQRYVPKDIVDTNIKLAQARGKLRTPELLGMVVRSKVDRLLAPK